MHLCSGFVFKIYIVNRRALSALVIALLLPLLSYFLVKHFSDQAVVVPRHYLPDSTFVKNVDGKSINDTAWHHLQDFSLTNQLGEKVSWKEVGNSNIVVADFFFTHCPTICVPKTKNIKRLQESIKNTNKAGVRQPDFVRFLSFTIDPERDSVERLKYWADRFQINPENWWLLTGDKEAIYDMAINEMKIGLVDGKGIDTSFFHSDYLVLIDRNRTVRGFYRGLDSTALAKLSEDIIFLTLEKDRSKKSVFEGKLEIIAVAILCALVAVGIFLIVFRRKPNK